MTNRIPQWKITYWLNMAFFTVIYTGHVQALDGQFPIKSFHTDGTFISIGSNTSVIIPEAISFKFRSSINEIKQTISNQPPTENPMSIDLKVLNNISMLPKHIRDVLLLHKESYWISTSSKNIHIISTDDASALDALTTLENIIINNNGLMPVGDIIDWPSLSFRGVLIVPGPGVSASEIKQAVTVARRSRMNALLLYLNTSIAFKSWKNTAKSDAISLPDLSIIMTYANKSGLEVIPLVNLLTRQSYSGLIPLAKRIGATTRMYNEDTYDPDYPANYQFVFSFLDEIIEQMHPRIVHIGHSEVLGCYPKYKKAMEEKGQKILPADLFLKDVRTLHSYLKDKSIETMMWGDMLISHDEFPNMYIIGVNGNMPGYGAPLRQSIPKDIVIADWHYTDEQKEFPSTKAFADDGFKVIGTTWKIPSTTKNFSRYMSTSAGANGIGMLAGIWGFWKDPKDVSHKLITSSGNTYWGSE